MRRTLAQKAELSSTLPMISASSMHRCTLEVSMKLALMATEVSKFSTYGSQEDQKYGFLQVAGDKKKHTNKYKIDHVANLDKFRSCIMIHDV